MHVNVGVGVEGVVELDGGDGVILPRVEGGGVGSGCDSSVEADTVVVATAFATTASIAASVALVAAPFPAVAAAVAFVSLSAAPAADADGHPLPPRIVDRSNLVKLELRVEKFPPSNPVAPTRAPCGVLGVLTDLLG